MKHFKESKNQNRSCKKIALAKEDKKKNQELASERVANENVIGMIKLKRLKIISDKCKK